MYIRLWILAQYQLLNLPLLSSSFKTRDHTILWAQSLIEDTQVGYSLFKLLIFFKIQHSHLIFGKFYWLLYLFSLGLFLCLCYTIHALCAWLHGFNIPLGSWLVPCFYPFRPLTLPHVYSPMCLQARTSSPRQWVKGSRVLSTKSKEDLESFWWQVVTT